ncbi:hypothetical protein [Streptomyces sp. HUAS ZL42]|uniref:hypothetical protein n=1 Tax=Streptomyces sp. HUAS ZL42 TaxID=3231715 RepID=UPI00345E580F
MSTAARSNGKHILVLCELDAYANRLKPLEIQRFLQERGHDVRLVDTYTLSLASGSRRLFGKRLPSPRPTKLALYATEVASAMLIRHWSRGRHALQYYLLVADLRLRRAILKSSLPLDDFDLVICEYPHNAEVLADAGSARTLYDCPAPWADEMYFDGSLTERQHGKLRRRERELFENVDHLSFHWESYARYAVEQYGISGRNLLGLGFGCNPSTHRARFGNPPRIVYIGNLSAGFNDTPLLARLAQLYPHIDVYGGPPPDPELGLNYLGYAPSLDVLRQYQIGLVTCTRDPLRRDGFSSKQVQYIAHGLPVLVPAWRRHMDLLRGSVAYTEQNFRSVIDTLSEEKRWQSLSDEAYAQAQRLTWDNVLRPLETLLAGIPATRMA